MIWSRRGIHSDGRTSWRRRRRSALSGSAGKWQVFVIAQALASVPFAELQYLGLKRSAEAVCG
ncbi:hypothetical protein A7D27_22335 [Pseudomonas sp. 1D4]|nr:hypothetical protein A7D27_22335 [Pseudomonas sp. 1D4]